MKIIYLILIIFVLIVGGLLFISGIATNWIFCIVYTDVFVMPNFETCGDKMKSRLLIIIGIICVTGITVFGLASIISNFDQNTSKEHSSNITFPQGKIKIDDVYLNVQIADTELRRVRGLMFQEQLPYDQGMIFVFDEPGLYPLWMLNMQFALDMVWFDKHGNVVHIETDALPCKTVSEITNCQSIIPEEEALYILEVTSGFVEKFSITKDSKFSLVTHDPR